MDKDPHEEKLKQIQLIGKLATRLPWIVVAVSLLAFFLILGQLILNK